MQCTKLGLRMMGYGIALVCMIVTNEFAMCFAYGAVFVEVVIEAIEERKQKTGGENEEASNKGQRAGVPDTSGSTLPRPEIGVADNARPSETHGTTVQ